VFSRDYFRKSPFISPASIRPGTTRPPARRPPLWTEASIAQGLGRTGEAEAAYREVQGKFLDLGKNYDVALVSLDLATLLAGEGRTEELKGIAGEILPVFESREVPQEALAALLLFQRACAEERATAELVRQIAATLRRGHGAA